MPTYQHIQIHLVKPVNTKQVELILTSGNQSIISEKQTLDYGELTQILNNPNTSLRTIYDLPIIGKALYNWLNGDEQFLSYAVAQCFTDQLLVLAFSGDLGLLNIPWELLHDGHNFLVLNKLPQIVPLRWTPSKTSTRIIPERALEMIFMASAPLGEESELPYEKEEISILKATERLSLNMRVEESGSFQELRHKLQENTDVIHLVGKVGTRFIEETTPKYQPYFLAEDEFGDAHKVGVDDFYNTFKRKIPPLLFLSGGASHEVKDDKQMHVLASKLMKVGFPAVLAWIENIANNTARVAASEFYKTLSEGATIPHALHQVYTHLLSNKQITQRTVQEQKILQKQWYLLRLYAHGTLPNRLIEEGIYPKLASPKTSEVFLDPIDKKIRVANKDSFVGRRRIIQQCLKVFKQSKDKIGIVLHGMGGLGKSSIAARLHNISNSNYKTIVLVGELDEQKLIQLLHDQLGGITRNIIRKTYNENLKSVLKKILEHEKFEKRLLFIIDDLEQNAEMNEKHKPTFSGGVMKLSSKTVDCLKNLILTIKEYKKNDFRPQILFTSRYPFKIQESNTLQFIALNRLEIGAWQRFEKNNNIKNRIQDKSTIKRCQSIASRNPRLMQWLLKVVENTNEINQEELFTLLEDKKEEFKEDILAQYLIQQQCKTNITLLNILAHYEIPISVKLLQAHTKLDLSQIKTCINSMINISLIEQKTSSNKNKQVFYEIPYIIKTLLKHPTEKTYHKAAETLNRVFIKSTGESVQSQKKFLKEICRLGVGGKSKHILKTAGLKYILILNSQENYRELIFWGEEILKIVTNHPEIYGVLGKTWNFLGKTELALTRLNQALDTYDTTNDKKGQLDTMFEKANILFKLGQINKALQLTYDIIKNAEETGDEHIKHASLYHIAYVFTQRGQLNQAIDIYKKCRDFCKKIKDYLGEASILNDMAYTLVQCGKVDEALQLYQESLQINKQMGNAKGQSYTLHLMAHIFRQYGQLDKALQLYQESLEIKTQIGAEQGKAVTLYAIGKIHQQRGKLHKALQLFHNSLEIFEKISDKKSKSYNLRSIASVLVEHDKLDKALQLVQEGLQISKEINDQKGISSSLASIAQVLLKRNKLDDALQLLQESLQISNKISDENGKYSSMYKIATILQQRGQTYESLQLAKQSLIIAERIEYMRGIAKASLLLSELLTQSKQNYIRVLKLLQDSVNKLTYLQSPKLKGAQETAIKLCTTILQERIDDDAVQYFLHLTKTQSLEIAMEWAKMQISGA